MISERRFASTHIAFWNAITPMCERFVRLLNLQAIRFAYAVEAVSEPTSRALIAEVGFEIFARHLEQGAIKHSPPLGEDIEAIEASATNRLFRHASAELERQNLTDTDLQEAKSIAWSLWSYFLTNQPSSVEIRPQFRGCGIISACEGDIAAEDTLFEVKSVSRGLGVADIRQVITYLALQYSEGKSHFKRVAFINPRRGITVEFDVSEMSNEVSGIDIYDLLDDVVKYVSDLASALSGRQ